MNSRSLSLRLLIAALLLGAIPQNFLHAQASWKIPIYVRERAQRDTLWFGYTSGVAGCFDGTPIVFGCDTVNQSELPPDPPAPITYFKWDFKERCSGTNGSKTNIKHHPFAAAPTKADTMFQLYWSQVDPADSVFFSWPANMSQFASVMKLQVVGGPSVDMTTTNSLTLVAADGADPATLIRISIANAGIKIVDKAPPVPSLAFPTDGTKDVHLDTTLSWNAVEGAISYRVQVSANPAFSSFIVNKETTGTGVKVKFPKGGTPYYWRVSAANIFQQGCFTGTATITTIVTTIDGPQLVTPDANALNVATPVLFKWRKVLGATGGYQIQISTTSAFSTLVKDSILTDTTMTVVLQNCLTYFWRGYSLNPGKGDPSGPRSFTVVAATPAVPVPSAPADNATGVDGRPTLTWTGDACVQTYHIQIALDNAFTNIAFDSDVNNPSFQTDPLIGQTDYFWHVNARNTVGTSTYSSTRKFTTKTLPPTTPVLIDPVAGKTIGATSVTLAWHKAFNSPQTYHVQVDTNPNFAHMIVNDSTITDTTFNLASLLNCSHYFWRVSGKNAAGIGSYPPTADFFTPTLVPGAPDLLQPADNAAGLAASVTLTWGSADVCSKRFVLLVGLDNSFTQVFLRETLLTTSRALTGLPGETDFFWKVASLSGAGSSGFSTPNKFTTGAFLPSVPVLISPSVGAILASSDAQTFTWRASTNKPRTYRFQVDTSTGHAFTGTLYKDLTVADTSVALTDLIHCWTNYAWRVAAVNPAGTTAFSAMRTFSTPRQTSGTPTLIFPPDNSEGVADKPTLTWSGDPCTQSFKLQVSKDAAFGTLFAEQTTAATSFRLPTIEALTTYYWRVYAINEKGTSAANVFHFKSSADQPPSPPDRVSPKNGEIKVPVAAEITWDSTERAVLYHLQIAVDNGMTIRVVDDSTITGLSAHPVVLSNSTKYYWRMRAKGPAGWGNFNSDIWSFTTLSPPAAPRVMFEPVDELKYAPLSPQFKWSLSDGAEYYQIQLADNSEFNPVQYTDSVTVGLKQYPRLLKGWTTYYWRVRGHNGAGYGPFAGPSSFTTVPDTTPNWIIPLTVAENGPMRDTIYFGVNGRATYGIDPLLYEFELPPPSFGIFDARFVDPDSRPGLLGQGLRVNRYPFRTFQQVDTFKLTFQPGTGGYPMNFSWPISLVQDVCDSMVLMDEFGGARVRVRMDEVSSTLVSLSSISSLLIVEYSARPTKFQTPLGVMENRLSQFVPHGYQLFQNYPNPFNPTTQITYSSDFAVNVRLGVYDVLGREVAVLQNGAVTPGLHVAVWDGRNQIGGPAPSGVYYARIIMTRIDGDGSRNDRYNSVRKMLMMK